MFIGKWNKSTITTYIGLSLSIIGMFFATQHNLKITMICLMLAGICDLIDGTIARRCKRTEEEKLFGMQLDSLVDVISFLAFPIIILISMGGTNIFNILAYLAYSICGIARLAYFNITSEEVAKEGKSIKYYMGLPVTFIALILPLTTLFNILITSYNITMQSIVLLIVALLYILKIKVRKPTLKVYPIIFLIAIATIVAYVVIL